MVCVWCEMCGSHIVLLGMLFTGSRILFVRKSISFLLEPSPFNGDVFQCLLDHNFSSFNILIFYLSYTWILICYYNFFFFGVSYISCYLEVSLRSQVFLRIFICIIAFFFVLQNTNWSASCGSANFLKFLGVYSSGHDCFFLVELFISR